MKCDVMKCDVITCDVVTCDVVTCDVVTCDVVTFPALVAPLPGNIPPVNMSLLFSLILPSMQVSAPNWGTYLTSMDVNQHGIYSNDWTAANGNSVGDTAFSVPPTSGRGRPQTMFSVVKLHDQTLKVHSVRPRPRIQFNYMGLRRR